MEPAPEDSIWSWSVTSIFAFTLHITHAHTQMRTHAHMHAHTQWQRNWCYWCLFLPPHLHYIQWAFFFSQDLTFFFGSCPVSRPLSVWLLFCLFQQNWTKYSLFHWQNKNTHITPTGDITQWENSEFDYITIWFLVSPLFWEKLISWWAYHGKKRMLASPLCLVCQCVCLSGKRSSAPCLCILLLFLGQFRLPFCCNSVWYSHAAESPVDQDTALVPHTTGSPA